MSSSSKKPSFTIGYYVPPAKFEELDFQDFLELCNAANIQVTQLNEEFFEKHFRNNENNPSFDLILHTLSDIICENVDPSWLRLLDYIREQNKNTIVIDPPEKISPLLDRYEQYCVLRKAAEKEKLFEVPAYLRILDDDVGDIDEALSKLNIKFPVICKPLKCDAPVKSHYHKIIFDKQHLKDCERPCVLQQFIEHDALLFKINIIGDQQFQVVERKSIRNLKDQRTNETIAFNSVELSGFDSDHVLSKATEQTLSTTKVADQNHLYRIAQSVRQAFQLHLLSIDVLRISNTDTYAVVDVNYFPCYNDVDRPSKYIYQMCLEKLNKKSSN